MEKKLKRQMMELWKKTFHDSDEYIRLVFDSYFTPDMVEYAEKDGEIIAGMLAIPYKFGSGENSVKGAYLCGLATDPKYRGGGIMTSMLDRISERMAKAGYSFLFLIPADKGLERYYGDRGFVPGFYRQKEFYTSVHDFLKGEVNKRSVLKCSIISKERNEILSYKLDDIISFISDCQNDRKGFFLNQDRRQIEVFIKENQISGGEIYIAEDAENKIKGIGFYVLEDETSSVVEKERYVVDRETVNLIRNECKKNHHDRSMTLEFYGEVSGQGKSIWEPAYPSFLPEAPLAGAVGITEEVYNSNLNAEIYGMIKILDISEILKFLNNDSKDLKYTILVRQKNSDKFIRFSKDRSGFNEELIKVNEKNRVEAAEAVSEIELAKILFRRPGGDKIIEEVLGIPALNGQISMLLD